MSDLLSLINNLLWSSVLVYLLIGTGIYFSFRTRLMQIRHFSHMFSVLKNSHRHGKSGISSFQALCTSLAARIGTGSLTGVAIALTVGGPGAIFWMWIVAFIGMATSFIESTLAQLYKTRDAQGNFRGGPADYMEKGLGLRWMGVMFSIFLIIAFGLVFNAFQANSIAQASHVAFHIPPLYMGLTLVVLCGIIIFGGMRSIARAAQILVPVMALSYLIIAAWVIGDNLQQLPAILLLIVKSAFGLQEAAAGAVGYGISQALTLGVQRGLFSNEAGMGSAPNAAAAADPYPPHPASQGYVQMLGVFVDTIVICSATALIILSSGALQHTSGDISGIELIQLAFSSAIGSWGAPFIAIVIFFFAFTSIIANYAYAENNIVFLQQNHPRRLLLFRCFTLGMVLFGTLAELPLIWMMANISMALMALTNLVALLLLSEVALRLAKDYNHQRRIGKLPTLDVNKYPDLIAQIEPGIWGKSRER